MSDNTTVPWCSIGNCVYTRGTHDDVPVATFHTSIDAHAAVAAHNAALAHSKDDLDLTADDMDTLMEAGEPVEVTGSGTITGGSTRTVTYNMLTGESHPQDQQWTFPQDVTSLRVPSDHRMSPREIRWADTIDAWNSLHAELGDDDLNDLLPNLMALADEEHDALAEVEQLKAELLACAGERDRARGLAAVLEAETARLTGELAEAKRTSRVAHAQVFRVRGVVAGRDAEVKRLLGEVERLAEERDVVTEPQWNHQVSYVEPTSGAFIRAVCCCGFLMSGSGTTSVADLLSEHIIKAGGG